MRSSCRSTYVAVHPDDIWMIERWHDGFSRFGWVFGAQLMVPTLDRPPWRTVVKGPVQ